MMTLEARETIENDGIYFIGQSRHICAIYVLNVEALQLILKSFLICCRILSNFSEIRGGNIG